MIALLASYFLFCLLTNLFLFFWALRSKKDREKELEDRKLIRERLERCIESGPFVLG